LRAYFDSLTAKFPDRADLVGSVVSSHLGRAHHTARIALRLSDHEAQKIRIEPRFAETHLGHAEGLTREELAENFGEQSWNDWISLGEESWHAKFPGGETKGEVRDRALEALNELTKENRPVWFIATHGGLLRRILHHFHPDITLPIEVTNGSVFKFIYQNGVWSVEPRPVFVPN
jgi:broad specificity phosphatase PhoE